MTAPRAARGRLRLRPRNVILVALAALASWVVIDLYVPRHADFRDFDALTMGRLDTDMWRSYYERKPVRLFRQLAKSLRVQFHTGYWRS